MVLIDGVTKDGLMFLLSSSAAEVEKLGHQQQNLDRVNGDFDYQVYRFHCSSHPHEL